MQNNCCCPIEITKLPICIVKPGNFILCRNLKFCGNYNSAIKIQSSRVTIDLNGYEICNESPLPSNGITTDSNNGIVIKNGSINGFTTYTSEPNYGYGIYFINSNQVYNENIIIRNGSGGITHDGGNDVIHKNIILYNINKISPILSDPICDSFPAVVNNTLGNNCGSMDDECDGNNDDLPDPPLGIGFNLLKITNYIANNITITKAIIGYIMIQAINHSHDTILIKDVYRGYDIVTGRNINKNNINITLGNNSNNFIRLGNTSTDGSCVDGYMVRNSIFYSNSMFRGCSGILTKHLNNSNFNNIQISMYTQPGLYTNSAAMKHSPDQFSTYSTVLNNVMIQGSVPNGLLLYPKNKGKLFGFIFENSKITLTNFHNAIHLINFTLSVPINPVSEVNTSIQDPIVNFSNSNISGSPNCFNVNDTVGIRFTSSSLINLNNTIFNSFNIGLHIDIDSFGIYYNTGSLNNINIAVVKPPTPTVRLFTYELAIYNTPQQMGISGTTTFLGA